LRTLLFVPVLMIFVSTVASSQAPLDERDFVVEGLSPGSDSNRVIARLGRPESVTTEKDPIDPDGSIHDWDYSGLVVIWYSPDEVSAFVLLTSGRSTRRGLRVGVPAADVRRLYGSPTRIDRLIDPDGAPEEWTYEDPSEPLRVVMVTIRAGKVAQIFVGTVRD
jgi:hypothetical protein